MSKISINDLGQRKTSVAFTHHQKLREQFSWEVIKLAFQSGVLEEGRRKEALLSKVKTWYDSGRRVDAKTIDITNKLTFSLIEELRLELRRLTLSDEARLRRALIHVRCDSQIGVKILRVAIGMKKTLDCLDFNRERWLSRRQIGKKSIDEVMGAIRAVKQSCFFLDKT